MSLHQGRFLFGVFLQRHRKTAKTKNITLSLEKTLTNTVVHADQAKINEVISNFIDNAIKYSPKETVITLSVQKTSSDMVEVLVEDEGVGVPKKEQPLLFTKFGRTSQAQATRPEGLGLGLYLAKKTIDTHGGEIVFESEEGKGSSFGFRLRDKV